MSVQCKCPNIGNCDRADRKDLIVIPGGADLVCPECGSELVRQGRNGGWGIRRIGMTVAALVVVALGGWYIIPSRNGVGETPAPPPAPPPPSPPEVCAPQPLLMEGKTTLYQRVLTRPDAVLASQPGGSDGEEQLPFIPYYVYNRQSVEGKEWLHVGLRSDDCKRAGWLNKDSTVEWNQQLTLAFTNPAGRDRVLFFERRPDLEEIVTSPDPASKIDPIMRTIRGGGRDPRVVAIEPENFIDISKKFYLLPIVESAEIRSGSGKGCVSCKSHRSASRQIPKRGRIRILRRSTRGWCSSSTRRSPWGPISSARKIRCGASMSAFRPPHYGIR